MEQLFGRYEAASLLAVERANGGELAPLEQVIGAFEMLFGSSVTAETFTESLELLIDAYLIAWTEQALELTPEGRKVIRRSGAHWDEELPEKVAANLQKIDEADMSPEGELPYPTQADVEAALASLGRGQLEGMGSAQADEIAPSQMAGVQTFGARMMTGLPGGMNLRMSMPGGGGTPAVGASAVGAPAVGEPAESDAMPAGAGAPAGAGGAGSEGDEGGEVDELAGEAEDTPALPLVQPLADDQRA